MLKEYIMWEGESIGTGRLEKRGRGVVGKGEWVGGGGGSPLLQFGMRLTDGKDAGSVFRRGLAARAGDLTGERPQSYGVLREPIRDRGLTD